MELRTNLQRYDFILFAMFKKKLTKVDLAKLLNISYPTMLSKLNNIGNLRISEASELCEILDINLIELITINNFKRWVKKVK